MTDVWVIGDGGQARETLDLLTACGFEALGLVGRDEEEAWLAGAAGRSAVLGLGFPGARRAALSRLEGVEVALPTLTHPTAAVGRGSTLGPGVVVSAHCVVTTDVTIGAGTVLNPRSGVGHDAVLGRCCVLNPGASVSGHVTLGDDVLVGSHAVVLQGLTVGDGATIGAGAVVTHDVAAGQTVVGVPARPQEAP